jgi:deoxycytidine triphosphate deaminase
MRLVYNDYGYEVKVGDTVRLRDNETATVVRFDKPHKPSSSGKCIVSVKGRNREYYVGVIGAEWIEREDRL